jgi:alanyl-tRNA synthetase
MSADSIREKFLSFFRARKHKIIASDTLAPSDDPTVLFTPAGMNQFKKEFLGLDSGFSRAATCQRCLRTDDLDKVGKTSGHHTFFEMLGNFSFGDYFKEEAIAWAWEFLTRELKINPQRLWVSVYKDDTESYAIWKDKIKVPPEKIIKLGDKENFWPAEAKEKGPNGPCGPCSEIFFDHGKEVGCGRPDCNPSCDCARFVEVWNLVFTQYNRKDGAILEPLPKKNIDTGMGFERLVATLAGVESNFESELFAPIIKEIKSHLNDKSGVSSELLYAVSDHIRAIAFAICDGVLPSNEARGYVIRKLIRKSTLHLQALGIKKPLLFALVPLVADIMQRAYPEIRERQEEISEIVLSEEKGFLNTLRSSPELFEEKFSSFSKKQNPQAAGKIAFQLYDTYGIPLELTRGWLEKKAIDFSRESFDQELAEQKTRSQAYSAMKGEVFSDRDLLLKMKETKFVGYHDCASPAKIIKIFQGSREIKKLEKSAGASIILDKTPFYPESGGQVGDTGIIKKGKNIFEVSDTKKNNKVVLHLGKIKDGSLKPGDEVSASVNLKRRTSIARNHTATHLLQAALRKVLGKHVKQQGSLVAEDRLRFDFTHFKALSQEELSRVEELVNGYILDNSKLVARNMTLGQAKKAQALAFFQEKYAERVRVISVGDFSRELCGGTHLNATGEIGLFKIIQEGSVASGVRRIEAATGNFAYKIVKQQEEVIKDVSELLGVPAERIKGELQKLSLRLKELEKRLATQRNEGLKTSVEKDIQSDSEVINGVKIINTEQPDMDSVRKAVDFIKQKVPEMAVIVSTTGTNLENKILWAVGVTEDLLAKGIDAQKLAKESAPVMGGSGGGRKDLAQGGGTQPENRRKFLDKIKELIKHFYENNPF